MIKRLSRSVPARRLVGLATVLLSGGIIECSAQQAPANNQPVPREPSAATPSPAEVAATDDLVVLSPFVVEASGNEGYLATHTLSGTRLRTSLRDVGSAISVVTEQFLSDTASVRAEDLLVYTTNTEIGGVGGNTSGVTLGRSTDETGNLTTQNVNQRIRGLSGADNTREFFLTDIPWDGYNIGRVDMQRGPNSILFGLGSPAGVVNAGILQAGFRNEGKIEVRIDQFGTKRASLNYNRVLIPDQLSIRVGALEDRTKYRQDPAFNDDRRFYAAIRFDPEFLRFGRNSRGSIRVNYENGDIKAARPRVLPPIDRISPWFQEGTFTVPANPDFGKPAATYNALNRAVFNNWDMENYRSWVPNSGIQNQDGRNWINPANRTQTAYEWTRATNRTYVQIGSRPDFYGVGATSADRGEWGYQPWVSEWYNTGVLGFFDGVGNPNKPNGLYAISNRTQLYGIDRFGKIDKSVDAFPYSATQAITEPWKYAKGVSLPFQSAYRDMLISDTKVFDFYNQLLDGNTRSSWRKFNVASAAYDQTFLDNRLGISFAYDKQKYEDGFNAVISERNQAINVEVNGTYAANNLPNPNAGRAMILGGGASGGKETIREEARITAFGELRAEDFLKKSWLTRMLGKHILTGLLSENSYTKTDLGWKRWMLDPSIMSIYDGGVPNTTAGGSNPTTSNSGLDFTPVFYLTGDMRDRTMYPSLNSLNLVTPKSFDVPDAVNLTYFDSRWNRSLNPADASYTGSDVSRKYVNPNAMWINTFYLDPREPPVIAIKPASVSQNTWNSMTYANKIAAWDALPQADKDALIAATIDPSDHYTGTGKSRQSENPENYVGWRSTAVPLLDGADEGVRKTLMTQINMSKMKIKTQAFVWQGSMFGGNLVPTFGWRKDTARAYMYQASAIAYGLPGSVRTQDGRLIADSALIKLPSDPFRVRSFQNRSWSIVGHTPGFIRKHLPWGTNISISYNTSSNFNPQDASRSDLFGREMAPSSGTTKDIGVHVSTWNDKVSFRVIKYTTKNENVSIGGSPIGDIKMAEARGWVMAKRLEAGLAGESGVSYNIGGPDINDIDSDGNTSEFIQTAADLEKQRSIVRAVLDNVPVAFFDAWQINRSSDIWRTSWDPGTQPPGITAIQDRSSSGYEYELTMRPVKNWSITANFSKTRAVTDNNYKNLLAFVEERTAIWRGPAGMVPYPNGNPSSETQGANWEQHVIGKMSSATITNGEAQQEMVPKRFNLVTNYKFSTGRLKGLSLGGAYRWQDKAAIGYQYTYKLISNEYREVKDLGKPFFGQTERAFDFWIAYESRLSKKLVHTIQLNVRSVGDSNHLVPVGAWPDGTIAQWRIAEGQSWSLTNTIRF